MNPKPFLTFLLKQLVYTLSGHFALPRTPSSRPAHNPALPQRTPRAPQLSRAAHGQRSRALCRKCAAVQGQGRRSQRG
eukprot:1230850-Amorphochlora_amoeboformis.AAC.1